MKKFHFSISLLLLAPAFLFAQDFKLEDPIPTDPNVKIGKLSNGLTYYIRKNAKPEDYISWEEYFMAIAKLTAMRSKDPSTQVGACIVSSDNRILSVGYNGTPNGYDDHYFPWDREGDALETKYLYVVHAERNAILNYRGSNKDLEGAKIYVDLFPCNECAKEIIQVGIKELYYLEDKYKDTKEVIASKKMLDACGVKYTCLKDKIDV